MTVDILTSVAALLGAIAWPSVAVFAALTFRREIVDLVRRIRKGGGAEFDPPLQQIASSSTVLTASRSETALAISQVASNTLQAFPRTPATAAWEETLKNWDVIKGVESPTEREQVMLRLLARAMVVGQFERVDASIWKSQLSLLTHLNGHAAGESPDTVKTHFYDPATVQFPTWYSNYTFESWLSFLTNAGMLTLANARVAITADGREYLTWRVQQARPDRPGG